MLGRELRLVLGDRAMYAGHRELDISNEAMVKAFFAEGPFDFIINCAAYTAVDKAENNAETAERVNTLGPSLLARYGRRIIHLSTNHVFDGRSFKPWREDDAPNPLSVYGKTKLAGENAVLAEAETAVIIRTSWLYSCFGKNFVKDMRKLGAERDSIDVVYDRIGAPTNAASLATVIVSILPQLEPGMKEIFHYSAEGVTSWYDIACLIIRLMHLPCIVRPIESDNHPARVAQPAYSVFSKTKIRRRFGLTIPHWQSDLERCMRMMNKNSAD